MAKLCNWAAQGPDGIQGFWIKRFIALRSVVLAHFNTLLSDGSLISPWFPTRRTILILKTSDATQPKKFLPNDLFKCSIEIVDRMYQ